jgi:hypothetical protein
MNRLVALIIPSPFVFGFWVGTVECNGMTSCIYICTLTREEYYGLHAFFLYGVDWLSLRRKRELG